MIWGWGWDDSVLVREGRVIVWIQANGMKWWYNAGLESNKEEKRRKEKEKHIGK